MSSLRIKIFDCVVGIFALLTALFIFSETAHYPLPVDENISVSLLPRIMAIALAFLGMAIAAISFRSKERAYIQNIGLVFVAMILMGGYGLLVTPVGFPILTPLYVAALLWLMEYRRWGSLITLSLIVTGIIFILFNTLLHVPLPLGIFEGLFE